MANLEIKTAQEWVDFATSDHAGESAASMLNVTITDDLDFSELDLTDYTMSFKPYTNIDGGGHTIKNMVITRNGDLQVIYVAGVVKDLKFSNNYLSASGKTYFIAADESTYTDIVVDVLDIDIDGTNIVNAFELYAVYLNSKTCERYTKNIKIAGTYTVSGYLSSKKIVGLFVKINTASATSGIRVLSNIEINAKVTFTASNVQTYSLIDSNIAVITNVYIICNVEITSQKVTLQSDNGLTTAGTAYTMITIHNPNNLAITLQPPSPRLALASWYYVYQGDMDNVTISSTSTPRITQIEEAQLKSADFLRSDGHWAI